MESTAYAQKERTPEWIDGVLLEQGRTIGSLTEISFVLSFSFGPLVVGGPLCDEIRTCKPRSTRAATAATARPGEADDE